MAATAGSAAPGRGLTAMAPPLSGRPGEIDGEGAVALLRWPPAATDDGSIAPASRLPNSATRRVKVENSICFRNAISSL